MFSKLVTVPVLLTVFVAGAAGQQGNSEVFVFDVKSGKDTLELSNPRNISNSPGYDNQPSFGPDGTVLFTSGRNEGFDIYQYSLKDGRLKQITKSPDGEYTARAVGNGAVSFVREGPGQVMSVWKVDLESGKESPVLKNNEPVAYYDWDDRGGALVWVRYAFTARYVNPSKDISWFVSDNVQPSSPQRIPGTGKFSFVHRRHDGSLWINEFNPDTRAVRPITQVNDGKIDYCWRGSMIVMGSGSKLWGFVDKRPGLYDKDESKWQEIADLSRFGIKAISRLASSSDGRRLAVVSNQS